MSQNSLSLGELITKTVLTVKPDLGFIYNQSDIDITKYLLSIDPKILDQLLNNLINVALKDLGEDKRLAQMTLVFNSIVEFYHKNLAAEVKKFEGGISTQKIGSFIVFLAKLLVDQGGLGLDENDKDLAFATINACQTLLLLTLSNEPLTKCSWLGKFACCS